MIQPKNETENFLLSITKNCETLVEQTHRKPEETPNSKCSNQEKHFILNHRFTLEEAGCWV